MVVADGRFVDRRTNATTTLRGPNVVVKGAPWLPAVAGSTVCDDGRNGSCTTFNAADGAHIRARGWNAIRLGVTWAGAQPRGPGELDAAWVERLRAVLRLCDAWNISVLLDAHQDAVGTAVCGEGVPQWVSALATPGEIGRPLRGALRKQPDGKCGEDDVAGWAAHAGEDDYNTANGCCLRYNQGGWSDLMATEQAQATLHFWVATDRGRGLYAAFMGKLAAAVADLPAAVGIEPMNEPPSPNLAALYRLWEQCEAAIHAAVPDMAVAIADTGEAPLPGTHVLLPPAAHQWVARAPHLFYAWHWYGTPKDPNDALRNAQDIARKFGVPSLLTEFMSCTVQQLAEKAGVGYLYWHYSSYCNTRPSAQYDPTKAAFGACITGWGAGDSNRTGCA